MSTNQANHQTVVEPAAGNTQVRELSLHELQQVSGGLPHGTWLTAASTSTPVQIETDLPHGSW